MAIEARRGCGYRKAGGLYMVCAGQAIVCDRMPIPLEQCPHCGHGIKHFMGYKWITPAVILEGDHFPFVHKSHCRCKEHCPACYPNRHFGAKGQAGLIWVGAQHYNPEEFMAESKKLGVSRRINALPRGFKIGKTWVFAAHIHAITEPHRASDAAVFTSKPGIITAFKPQKIERIVLQSELTIYRRVKHVIDAGQADRVKIHAMKIYERLNKDIKRGITLVAVPDDDKDHNPTPRGS